mmetsp:Transcript_58241/g.125104  ORF Transcript_58241/g.125104 Transcript_58241/m.125104 type:complete len:295 (+) Transcript_58241:451-1335(+)
MHLGRLIDLLASHLLPAGTLQGRHSEVYDLHLQQPIARIVEQDILEGNVSVRNAQVMQSPNRREDLHRNGQHRDLALLARTRLSGAPREEVALGGQGGDDVGVLLVAKDALQVHGVWEAPPVQAPQEPDVAPRKFGRVGMPVSEVVRPQRHPRVGHALHRNLLFRRAVAQHHVHVTPVPQSVLEALHHSEVARVPRPYALAELIHALVQLELRDGCNRSNVYVHLLEIIGHRAGQAHEHLGIPVSLQGTEFLPRWRQARRLRDGEMAPGRLPASWMRQRCKGGNSRSLHLGNKL